MQGTVNNAPVESTSSFRQSDNFVFLCSSLIEQEALDVLHIRPRSKLRDAFLLNFTERLRQFSWRRIREQEENEI